MKPFCLLLVVVFTGACVVAQPPPAPPDRPQPSTSFDVSFVPAGAEVYPPTDVKEVERFKNVIHWGDEPPDIITDETPTRPFVLIGELRFGQNWYYSSNIKELIDSHVPRVGGDAVLAYHAHQTANAMMYQDTGEKLNVYYQSIVLEVIRYTDR